MAGNASLTRAQIIIAADDLFYSEGFSAVSMERIAERAGVTKKTLYYHFRSKDDLMGAYLDARAPEARERYRLWAGDEGCVGERMERMYRKLADASKGRNWRGCGFLRAAFELGNLPGHPAAVAARQHKENFEAWLRSLLEEEGRTDAALLAKILMIMLDGAIAQVMIHRNPAYAEAAAYAARTLLGTCGDKDASAPAPASEVSSEAAIIPFAQSALASASRSRLEGEAA